MRSNLLLLTILCFTMLLSCDSPYTTLYGPGIGESDCPNISLVYTNQLETSIQALIHGYDGKVSLGRLDHGETSQQLCEDALSGYSEMDLILSFKVVIGRDTFSSGYGWCGTGLMEFTTGDYEILIKEIYKGQQSGWNGLSYEIVSR